MTKKKNRSLSKEIDRKAPPKKVRPRGRYWPVLLCLLLFVAGAVAAYRILSLTTNETGSGTAPGISSGTAPSTNINDMIYPVSLFEDGKARHFEQKTGDGQTIRYFVMKSSDGVIRAAFDACVVCWREEKGYYQKDDVMVCRNCGRRFPSIRINEVTGGCNPAPLTRRVENANVIIKAESFQEGKQFFGLSGGTS